MCFGFLYNFCLKLFSFKGELSELSQMYIDLHVKYPLFWSDFSKTWILFIQIFKKKNTNIKFYENPSGGSQVISYGPTDMTVRKVTFAII